MFQRAEVLGVLGKDSVVKTVKDRQYLTFSVAVSNGKDANGNMRESDWFEIMAPYNPQTQGWLANTLKAKSRVFVSGRMRSHAYTDKNGAVQSTISIFASQVDPVTDGAPAEKSDVREQAPQQPAYNPASDSDLPF